MIKRIVSIVLLVTMLMSFMVPGVYAAEDDGYIDNVVIENGNVPDELSNIVVVNEPETTNAQEETTAPVVETTAPSVVETTAHVVEETTEPEVKETTVPVVDVEPVSLVPPCDCGNADVEISVHSDGCAAKMFYKELCNGSAGDIYALWNILPQDGQAYIKLYLSWTNAKTLNNLELLIANNWGGEGDVASASKDGNLIGAFGVPEDAALQVENPSVDAQAAVDAFVADQEEDITALFTWDISVVDNEGGSWQPDDSVYMVLEVPGEKLNKNAKIFVVHVDDDGNAEKIPSFVTDDGKIAFYTNGFSTFAGFTVDFTYEVNTFALNGLTSITVSELMHQLNMSVSIEDVHSVTFSDESLLSVTAENGDWLLTSLQSFTSSEKLTITLVDGSIYEIPVTDPVYASVKVGGGTYNYDNDGEGNYNGEVTWNANLSGGGLNARGWSRKEEIVVDGGINGGGTMIINIQNNDGYTASDLYVDLYRLRIINGAKVTLRIGGFFESTNERVLIRSSAYDIGKSGHVMIWVESGSLDIVGRDVDGVNVDFVFGGRDDYHYSAKDTLTDAYSRWPLIMVAGSASSLSVSYAEFMHAQAGAIGSYSESLPASTSISVDHCIFHKSLLNNREDGAAIQLKNTGDASSFSATNCQFYGNYVYGRGGAISIESNVANITIDTCTFSGTTAASHGGAICINGDGDKTVTTTKVDIKNCTFTNTKANGNRGGAIRAVVSTPEFYVTNCTFSGNSAGSNGGAIGLQGTIGTLSISGSGFTNCTAGYAGGIAVDCTTTSTTISNCDFENCTSGNLEPMCYRNSNGDYLDANGNIVVSKATMDARTNKVLTDAERAQTQKTDAYGNQKWNGYGSGGAIVIYKKHGDVTITGTSETDRSTFTNCKTLNSGGAICFDDSFESSGEVKMDYLHIDGCISRDAGNAIYFGSCTIPSAILDHSLIENCTYAKAPFRSASYNENDLSALELSVKEPGTTMGNGQAVPQHNYDYTKMVFNTDDSGGTVRCIGDSRVVLTIQNSTLKKNESLSNGGAVYWNANRKKQKASENAADNAVIPKLTLNNCYFEENIALRDGGAVYAEASITFSGGEFYRNIAMRGGAIAQQVYNNSDRKLQSGEKTEVILSATTKIYNNYARSCGGGVSILANTTGSIDNGTNLAFPITFQLGGAQVYNNLAAEHGGGIYFYQPSYTNEAEQAEVNAYVKTITIDNGSIHNNIAGYGKGTEAPATLITTLSGTISSGNAVGSGNGGGIYLEASENCTLSISTGNIYTNTARKGNGGGIYMTGKNAKCTITGGTIGGSSAKQNVATIIDGVGGNGGGIAISGGAKIDMTVATGATTGGTISYNRANYGGGIWLDASGEGELQNSITIAKGNINNNHATNNGGGICLMDNATAELSGGNIYSNDAFRGAGFFAQNNASFKISSGAIYSNPAGYHGGGGYVWGAKATIEGGSIYSNTAPNSGGGLYAVKNGDYPFTVTMKGGDIYNNSTSKGWGGGIYANGTNTSKIIIYDGKIHNNEATTGCGGGINIEAGAVIEMYGGNIYKNTSGTFGGGIQVYNGSSGTIQGGQIYENTADAGGGVAVCSSANLTIKDSQSGAAREVVAGKITNNTASRGGGVFVFDGGILTVTNGFITYNNATGKPTDVTTCLNQDSNLKGTGGGIYVASGKSGNPSKFILNGTNYAIYGNIAEFAADDVFANGSNTLLDVPLVKDMNLSGYEFKPRGWFEDYPNEDTEYRSGLKMNPEFANGNANGTIAENENERYKTAPGNKRYEIISTNGTKAGLPANTANTYVCMTLGYAGAVSDTIVVDYALDVYINVLDNDPVMNQESSGAKVVAVGPVTTLEYQKNLPSNFTSGTNGVVLNSDFLGKIIISDDKLQYQLQSMVFSDAVQFSYAALYGGDHYFGKVTIIPATTIYYEDFVRTHDKATSDSIATSNAIKYDTISYYEGTSTPLSGTPDGWNHQYTSGTTYGWFQAQDRPGTGNDNDADNNYGFDNSYANCTNFSKGRAHKFTAKREKVTVSGQTKYKITYGTATFKFSGTGFDIISATSSDTGTITAQVKDSSGAVVKSLVVDTYYGYAYENNQWVVVKPNSSNALYQVPVIKCTGLDYGTYEVVVTISYADFFDHNHDGSYDFYLDGIRVYDPANDGANNPTIKDAYVADEEGWPEYLELRNFLLKQKDFDSLDQSSSNAASGVIFIDGKGNIDGSNTKSVAIKDYHNFGPNNEIYLQPGQSIACNFTVPSTNNGAKVTSIQIGLKSVGGEARTRVYGIKDSKSTYAVGTSSQHKTINTATDLYYDITAINGTHIVITNDLNSPSILSITNVKITYDAPHTDYIEDLYYGDAYFKTTKAMASQTMESLNVLYGYVEAPASIDLVGATLSFEDEILTNLYYTTTSMDGVAEESMGLLTWSQMPEEVAVDAAENVYAGAVYVAESGRYMVQTDGIAAKELGDDIYMAVYAQMEDGSFIYSDVISYSPKRYAMSRLENSDNENLKALCVAMLNYGAEAQKYFGYKADSLMNADLTDEQQALVADYDATLFTGAVAADPAKVGAFAATETGFSGKSASVSFEGAFALNFYFAPDREDAEITFCYWTKDAYESAEILNIDNASGTVVMTADGNGVYHGQITGVAAKQLDDTYYVAAIYTVDGETYCSGVIAYSLSTYCMKNANSGMGELAQATAMYGYYAKTYFG